MVVNVRRVAVSPLAEPKTLRKSSSPFASLSGPVPTSPPTFFFFLRAGGSGCIHALCPCLTAPARKSRFKPILDPEPGAAAPVGRGRYEASPSWSVEWIPKHFTYLEVSSTS